MSSLPAGSYSVDPAHSNVGFEIKHMGISTVRGAFKKFQGSVEASDGSLKLSGAVEVASIDTGDEGRDGHLQTPDLFDAAQFPQITFSTEAAQIDGTDITLNGEITIKGVTKPITLTGTVAEGGEDPWGNERVGFEVAASVDRTEFNLGFNQTLPSGSLLIGNNVKLVVSVSAVKAA